MRQQSPDRDSRFIDLLAGVVACAFVVAMFTEALAARRGATTPTPQPTFRDELSTYDTSAWIKSDRWTNGSPFDNAWRADHITHASTSSLMTIILDNVRYLGEPYSSGEYRTKGFYSYGCYEARFRPIKRAGVITSFFTFAGPYDNGGNGKHNEIDIEIVGSNSTLVQFNFWTNDDTYTSNNAYPQNLGFDASLAMHNYGFKWKPGAIEWYVDGNPVYSVTGTTSIPVPSATDSYQKIMMNAWPVDSTASGWAGTFVYPGSALTAQYDWVRYDSNLVNCGFTPNL